MPASSAPDVASTPSATVTTRLGPHVLVHADMVAFARAGLRGANDGPCILRVVPLLHVAGRKGRRVVVVGHSLVAVHSVREIRYDLEHRLAQFSSNGLPTSSSTPIVASLLELSIICGRAADEAREAVREGLWLHLSDSSAYHSYRRLQDPSIINAAEPATSATRPWMRLHDAGVRQCMEMRKQLDAEAGSARNLMAAAASVSNSREADGQSAFNTLAAVVSLGLGIPALVLALYGADRLLPLNTQPRQLAFIPVAIGLLLAAVIAIWRAPKGRSGWIWVVAAIGIIALLLSLLVVAGLLAPDS
ncbi:hypothetical protein [Arthrobacter sp. D3-16]